ALLNEVAFLNVDDLGLRHQVLDRIPLVRDDRDLALRLVVANELDAAVDLGDRRHVLRHPRFEQLGNTRQTAGDVARLGRFTRGTREDVARLDLLAVLDGERRARGEHVTRSLGFVALLAGFLAEQGQARTQVLLLGATRGAVLRDDALGDAGGLVHALFHRLAVDQVLEADGARLLGDD